MRSHSTSLPDRFPVSSVAQLSAHVQSHTRPRPAHKELKGTRTGRVEETPWGVFAKWMAGWGHWWGGGWQWCIIFAEWRKKRGGKRLAGDAGDHRPSGSCVLSVCLLDVGEKEMGGGMCVKGSGTSGGATCWNSVWHLWVLFPSWSLVDPVSAPLKSTQLYLVFVLFFFSYLVESGSFRLEMVCILCCAVFSLVCFSRLPLPPPRMRLRELICCPVFCWGPSIWCVRMRYAGFQLRQLLLISLCRGDVLFVFLFFKEKNISLFVLVSFTWASWVQIPTHMIWLFECDFIMVLPCFNIQSCCRQRSWRKNCQRFGYKASLLQPPLSSLFKASPHSGWMSIPAWSQASRSDKKKQLSDNGGNPYKTQGGGKSDTPLSVRQTCFRSDATQQNSYINAVILCWKLYLVVGHFRWNTMAQPCDICHLNVK